MSTKHFGRAIAYYLSRYGINQYAMAERCGISQGALNRIINTGARPEPITQRALCTSWPDAETNVRITCERLRDELAICGHQPEEVEIAPRGASRDRAAKVTARLAEIAADEPDLLAILADLLSYVEYSRKSQTSHVMLRVAETPSAANTYHARLRKIPRKNRENEPPKNN
jgi:transcriptional regulator with XRE-family HTH domain